MGYICLLNCLALATGPHIILIRCVGLTESSAIWKCGQVAVAYALTQLAKMIFIATFFPNMSIDGITSIGIFMEGIRTFVDIIDLFGISLILDYLTGKGQFKIFIVGMGWAMSDVVLTKYLPIWFGARGLEFDWYYIMLSFEANLDLIIHLLTVLLIWLLKRKDINRNMQPALLLFLGVILFRTFIFQLFKRTDIFNPFGLFLLKIFFTLALGLFGLHFHLSWRKDLVASNGVTKAHH